MRGERLEDLEDLGIIEEIPPRARGTDGAGLRQLAGLGNTPACAGNGRASELVSFALWKYPRVRGERMNNGMPPQKLTEIPPRARGTGFTTQDLTDLWGNTPACAGNG